MPQHHGSVAYREVLQELIENNYFKSGADLDEGAFKALPNSVVPPLTLTALPPPPPPQDGVQPGSYADEDDEISRAVVAQDSIAEAFAMAKLFEDAPRDALVRSLTRARTLIHSLAPNNALTHLTHSATHSLTNPLTHSLICSLAGSPTH